jgi:hypothetical protein
VTPKAKSVAEEIERRALQLRDSTMGARMVPIGHLFGRFYQAEAQAGLCRNHHRAGRLAYSGITRLGTLGHGDARHLARPVQHALTMNDTDGRGGVAAALGSGSDRLSQRDRHRPAGFIQDNKMTLAEGWAAPAGACVGHAPIVALLPASVR